MVLRRKVLYTWSHNNDIVTAYRGALPQDSTNFKGDYGPSDFDQRNIFTGLVTYQVPGGQKWKPLTNGWQINTLATFHGGQPFSVYSSSDTSGTDDGNQRADLTGVDAYGGFRKNTPGANWLNPAAFVDAAPANVGKLQTQPVLWTGIFGCRSLGLQEHANY